MAEACTLEWPGKGPMDILHLDSARVYLNSLRMEIEIHAEKDATLFCVLAFCLTHVKENKSQSLAICTITVC